MRTILILTAFIFGLTSYGQIKTGVGSNRPAINIDSVDSVKITNNCSPYDSCRFVTYKLNESRIKNLIEVLNKVSIKDTCNYLPAYWLNIYFKDGTIRTFGLKESLIRENNKLCFDIRDSKYFEKLWAELRRINKGE